MRTRWSLCLWLSIVLSGLTAAGCSGPATDFAVEVAGGDPSVADGRVTLHGVFKGAMPEGHQLLTLAHTGDQYTLIWPPPQVDRNTQSWMLSAIRMDHPGGWQLELYLADAEASAQMKKRGEAGDLTGIVRLPPGMRKVHQISVMMSPAVAAAASPTPKETPAAPVAAVPR